MFNHFRACAVGLICLVGLTLACGDGAPSSPTPPMTPAAPLSVSGISPDRGSTSDSVMVTIRGTGFLVGSAVTLDAPATNVSFVSSTTITALARPHNAGAVDVVVTNPGGQSARLSGGFTYDISGTQPYTLTPGTNTVVARGQLSVSWTAPQSGALDWIGFFRVQDPSTAYQSGWWEYTNGATTGTLPVNVPLQPGQYEFRYLLDDGFVDVVRSRAVTVTAG